MTLLDTHTLLWLVTDAPSLGSKTRMMADDAQRAGELCIASISWWEIGMLVNKGRISLTQESSSLRDTLLDAGLVELALDGHIAIVSAFLKNFHGDPADRIIVASALVHGSVLLTADKKILGWEESLMVQDARL